MHKIKMTRSPKNLYNMYNWDYSYQTRQASNKMIKPKGIAKLEISKNSFRWRGADTLNRLPSEISNIEDSAEFKHSVKLWIRDNVTFKP